MAVLKNQLHAHKNRLLAKNEGRKTYNGSPCYKCGKTLRRVDNYGCINCCNLKGLKNAKTEKGKKWAFNSRIRNKYGLEPEDYEKMYNKQSKTCAICHGEFNNGRYKKPYVDHSHETKKVRGLLCHKCNSVLGYVNDDIRILKEAIKYLKKYE